MTAHTEHIQTQMGDRGKPPLSVRAQAMESHGSFEISLVRTRSSCCLGVSTKRSAYYAARNCSGQGRVTGRLAAKPPLTLHCLNSEKSKSWTLVVMALRGDSADGAHTHSQRAHTCTISTATVLITTPSRQLLTTPPQQPHQ